MSAGAATRGASTAGLRSAALAAGHTRAARRALRRSAGVRDAGAAPRLLSSARLLREARSNGDEFLALPPNGPDRNSINDSGSLLRALCRSSDATACTGPSAAEAEFRTNSGTWPRVGGLLLIVIGLLGMLLLLGYIGLRLLLAAILSVFYLLLTPGVVLLPALGESGRALFRGWAGRLLAAVVGEARVRVPAWRGARRDGGARRPRRSRLVGAVDAAVGVLVGRVPEAERDPGGGAAGARARPSWRRTSEGSADGTRSAAKSRGMPATAATAREASATGRRSGCRTRGRSAGSSRRGRRPPAPVVVTSRPNGCSPRASSFGRGARREALGRLAAGRSQLDRIERARRAAVASGERPRAATARLAARSASSRRSRSKRDGALKRGRGCCRQRRRRGRGRRAEEAFGVAGPPGRASQGCSSGAPASRARDYAALAGARRAHA